MDTSKIVDALQQDNNLDAEAQFKSVMQQKIGDALETKRREVARNGKFKYMKYFNSDIVSQYIIDKTFDLKSKNNYIWS